MHGRGVTSHSRKTCQKRYFEKKLGEEGGRFLSRKRDENQEKSDVDDPKVERNSAKDMAKAQQRATKNAALAWRKTPA